MAVDDQAREPTRDVWHFGLLALVGFMIVASLVLSTRSPILASYNNVAVAGRPPAGVVPPIGQDWMTTIHRSDWRPKVALALGRTGKGEGVRLGWIVRQWSFLGLPLAGFARPSTGAPSRPCGMRFSKRRLNSAAFAMVAEVKPPTTGIPRP